MTAPRDSRDEAPMPMNLRHIEAFKAVMEHGTVNRAAEAMHISQPAVSKLLQGFERAAGFPVFDRVHGRLSPTAEGLTLYRDVERVFAGVDEIRRAAGEIRAMRRGALSVGAMPALSAGFVQQVAFSFLKERPEVQLEIRAAQRVKLMDSVASGKLDLALCNSTHEHPEIETDLLSRQPAVCLLPPAHPLAKRAEISARDLKNESFVSWSEGTLTRLRVDALFGKLGIERRIAFSASTAPAICAFVANGLGVALVHPLYVGIAESTVAMRPFKPRLELDLLMAYPKRASRPALVKAFCAEALRQARALEQRIYKRP
jgi:DNA-binding transcriptional LysR family regulator